jgi:hypothetical protein
MTVTFPASTRPDTETLGNEVCSIITSTGALRTVERVIDDLTAAALDALGRAPLAGGARQALAGLARTATHRRA